MQTYGVASYKEADPTILTIITFPFIIGIMFGDAHGLLCFLHALRLTLLIF